MDGVVLFYNSVGIYANNSMSMLQQNNICKKYRLTTFSKRVKLWGVGARGYIAT
jgi:hypothetical protein